jgi:hypothetical protein
MKDLTMQNMKEGICFMSTEKRQEFIGYDTEALKKLDKCELIELLIGLSKEAIKQEGVYYEPMEKFMLYREVEVEVYRRRIVTSEETNEEIKNVYVPLLMAELKNLKNPPFSKGGVFRIGGYDL